MKTVLASLVILAALAANTAHAGSMAPAPRIIAKYERDFMVRSGAQTLQELLDTGIVRYSLTGGQSLLVLVNGRPYATTAGGLDALPLSAIERIELLSGDSLGTLDGSAVRGALNVVLRSDLDGFEARALTRLPSREGGDGWQGSLFWGRAVGEGGRLSVGVDVLDRQEITAQSREYSRSAWQEGGAFHEAQNISVGGNTVWVLQFDEDHNENPDRTPTGLRSVALGDCDPEHGYTGPLGNPPGPPVPPGDQGCGFAYGDIMWNTTSDERKTAVINLDHPLTEEADLHFDAIITQEDYAFRYAPSVGSFVFTPNEDLLEAINEAAGSDLDADGNDVFVGAHRFVRHGNRDWWVDTEEYDVALSLEGRISERLGYDVRIHANGFDGYVDGATFVHEGRIAEAIREGSYNLADPFSKAPEHRQAIEYSSLRLENPYDADNQGVRMAFEGTGFAIRGRDAAWTAGVEVDRSEVRDVTIYRSNDGEPHNVSRVLGSGGVDYSGERAAAAAFAEMSLPLAERLNLRIAGRGDAYDDVGEMTSWRVGADYRPNAVVTLRSAFSAGQQAPSLKSLHATAQQDHPYIDCDPGAGSPPRSSCTQQNPRQVTRETEGNPELDPLDAERITIGAEARRGPFFVDVEWYRHSRRGGIGRQTANWAMQNLPECRGGDRTDCIARTGGDITIHDRYANVVDWDLSGINARVGGGFRMPWGVVGMRGAWRRVTSAELRIAGVDENFAIPRNVVRLGALARRGNWSAVWTTSYRSSYENTSGTGTFRSWTGHDVVLDWARPLGVEGGRITGGVFNLTDAGLSVNTANPSSVDGPTEAGWGRTFFLSLNMQF